MGTRGAIGFRLNERDSLVYNQYDSYPENLGLKVVQFLADERDLHGKNLVADLSERVRLLISLPQNAKPTPLQIAALKDFTDLSVNGGRTDSFYTLLRKTQGDLKLILQAKYFNDYSPFMLDGLSNEYAYIINLDSGLLEFYCGFFQIGHGRDLPGRYWNRTLDETDEKYGVVLCAEYPLGKMTQRGVKARVKDMERAYEGMRKRYPRLRD